MTDPTAFDQIETRHQLITHDGLSLRTMKRLTVLLSALCISFGLLCLVLVAALYAAANDLRTVTLADLSCQVQKIQEME